MAEALLYILVAVDVPVVTLQSETSVDVTDKCASERKQLCEANWVTAGRAQSADELEDLREEIIVVSGVLEVRVGPGNNIQHLKSGYGPTDGTARSSDDPSDWNAVGGWRSGAGV